MISAQDAKNIADALEQAQAQGITQIAGDFVEDDTHMCALSAIYKVTTGETPWEWNNGDHGKFEIARDLQRATGIDFYQSYDGSQGYERREIYYLITGHNDLDLWTFDEIAETFRCLHA